ncbi:MAG TPA: Hpt domain-containing protein [Alphaproteobacteria bacterium]|nr:Hpt domain-containing protein [Alphaproteobacteria bacterium]
MAAVDLKNLREMTDGDPEMEKELFAEFISSFENELAQLHASQADGASETWRRRAHALKGIAFNLGAMQLGNLCKRAQEAPQSNPETKAELLKRIGTEFEDVRSYLDELMAA